MKNCIQIIGVFLIAILLVLGTSEHVKAEVLADEICEQVWVDPPGMFDMRCEGGGEIDPPCDETPCIPGIIVFSEYIPDPLEPGICYRVDTAIDNCTGWIVWVNIDRDDRVPCDEEGGDNPCDTFELGSGGITCGGGFTYNWYIEASVTFPPVYLDVRPYPATLVRWETAARCGGMESAQGSGTLNYAGNGGGSAGDPQDGDWRNLQLTLSLVPASTVLPLTLPNIGTINLPVVSDTSPPYIFQWEVPSHPAAGGGPLAGTIPGLDELPPDMPVFVGTGRTPYRLFWSFTYEEAVEEEERECELGPNGDGLYECKTNNALTYQDGHWEYYTVIDWHDRAQGGEVSPSQLAGLPPELAADLNGDGIPDAYWNNNLTIRRMDENNRVYGHEWTRSWNWGGYIYWGVREGQGQIGWPGIP